MAKKENLYSSIYIPVGEELGMQIARGQSALLDTGTYVLHCTKLFRWSMAYNQYKFTAWQVIPGKLKKMLINTIE